MGNTIIDNLNQFYPSVSLPSIKQIRTKGGVLISERYRTKKGKLLTHGHGRMKGYSFLENNIELFQRLTENGYIEPTVSTDFAGGRVADSFTLMPSWIRSMCVIDGEPIIEMDFQCLHPNIIMKLYGGNCKDITHNDVAEKLGIDLKSVKIAHLSFFNQKWKQMRTSPLFGYYDDNLLIRIKHDKDKHGYKVTSYKLFEIEVELMTAIIKRLNSMGVYVGYIYDALFCSWKHVELVRRVMNQEAKKMNIWTTAK